MTAPRPAVTHDPQVNYGRPLIGPVPTESVADAVWLGDSAETVADDYSLSRDQVLVACWYEATHGDSDRQPRWGAWATEHADAFHYGHFDAIPDPPAKPTPHNPDTRKDKT